MKNEATCKQFCRPVPTKAVLVGYYVLAFTFYDMATLNTGFAAEASTPASRQTSTTLSTHDFNQSPVAMPHALLIAVLKIRTQKVRGVEEPKRTRAPRARGMSSQRQTIVAPSSRRRRQDLTGQGA